MRIKEELEGVLRVLEKLRERDRDIPILVEGRKDRQALKKLGVGGKIILIKRRRSVFHIIEDLRGEYREVILLTDWDRAGGRLAHGIRKACEANDMICNGDHRLELIKYVKKEVKDVEGLPAFISRAELITKGQPKSIEKY